MKCSSVPSTEKRPRADACVLPFAQDGSGNAIPTFEDVHLTRACHRLIESKDFSAKEGEVVVLYPDPVAETRLVLVGLGEMAGCTADRIRGAFASTAKHLLQLKVGSVTCLPPLLEALSGEVVLRAILDGFAFGSYTFSAYQSLKPERSLDQLTIVCPSPNLFTAVNADVQVRMDAVRWARDLVNSNADDVNPDSLAAAAETLQRDHVQVDVYGKEWLERERMGLLLAVSRGSQYDPRFVVARWAGAPKDPDVTVLVGKGITFDTGGLNLKTSESMLEMKGDMAGAAAVLATVQAVSRKKLPVNVTAVVPLCENAVGPKSYKPGDVFISRAGKSVEIGNTDAEGRLILADALHYASTELKPSRIIDVATLTGAAEIALGNDISALFSNTDAFAFLLERAALHTGEPLWRMPLYMDYAKLLESTVADCKNIASRSGSAINAAVFLSSFIGKTPWAHLDIAGTAFLKEPRRYFPKGATGVPVRTLIEFVQSLIPQCPEPIGDEDESP